MLLWLFVAVVALVVVVVILVVVVGVRVVIACCPLSPEGDCYEALYGLAHLGDRVARPLDDEVAPLPLDDELAGPTDDEEVHARGQAVCGPHLDAAEWLQIGELSELANVDDAPAAPARSRPPQQPRAPPRPSPTLSEPVARAPSLFLDKDMNVCMEGRRHRIGFLRWWQLRPCTLLATCKWEGHRQCSWIPSYGPEVGGLERMQERLASWLAAGDNLSQDEHMRLRDSLDLPILSLAVDRISWARIARFLSHPFHHGSVVCSRATT